MHWLVNAARRANLQETSPIPTLAGRPVSEVWQAVADACGVSQQDLARHVAAALRVDVADAEHADAHVLKLVPSDLVRRFHVFPLRETYHELIMATSDPTNLEAETALAFASGRRIVFHLATPALVQHLITKGYQGSQESIDRLLGRLTSDLAHLVRVVDDAEPLAQGDDDADMAPIVKLTNLVLHDAVRDRASDIHFAPGDTMGSVRMRIDGVLREYMQLPLPILVRLISRVKILGRLDIADRVRPQDGKARVQIRGRTYDLRISVVPTKQAEKAVIRVLDPGSTTTLEKANLPSHELGRLRQLISFREGIVFVTGPTGSGKTTTLYAMLRELAARGVNVTTVEDPVEYELSGIAQIQVDVKRGVTFASALRAILRQDPDVILVGEIRDLETAHTAIQAAMTGHLVLATLHTNDAVGVVPRLLDIGLDRPSIAASLRGAVAQRLLRALCPGCSENVGAKLTADEQRLAKSFGVRPVRRAVGCGECGNTGYRGRVPELEVIANTPMFAEQIVRGASVATLQATAVAEGMRPIREVALERVAAGGTTLQEVERVLGESMAEATDAPREPHVLIVEDDAVQAHLARAVLEKSGIAVDVAKDGEEGWDMLGEGHFDLVVADLQMPTLDGRGLLARIRGDLRTGAIPVIVLTGARAEDLEAQVMDEGADDYIRKPYEPATFVARVKAALRRAGAA
jgi:type II secretory ATPase GspE/PulE/Tfp pilus assembly ATPase PilB-like protein/ActR/RegA family two-component response regulator